MQIARPDPSWLPFRTGVLRFHYNEQAPDKTPAELVQALCDWASEGTEVTLKYHEDEDVWDGIRMRSPQTFDVSIKVMGGSPFEVASFRIGEELKAGPFINLEEHREEINQVIAALYRHLQRVIKIQLEAGRCRLFARLGSTTAGFEEVPPDVFGHYEITGWKYGAATAPSGEWMFSIHLAVPGERLETAQSAPQEVDAGDAYQPYRTGAQGRPTSMHLILAEAQRRLEAGEEPASRAQFAAELSAWLAQKHPRMPATKPKAIQNNSDFAVLCRRYLGAPRKPVPK